MKEHGYYYYWCGQIDEKGRTWDNYGAILFIMYCQGLATRNKFDCISILLAAHWPQSLILMRINFTYNYNPQNFWQASSFIDDVFLLDGSCTWHSKIILHIVSFSIFGSSSTILTWIGWEIAKMKVIESEGCVLLSQLVAVWCCVPWWWLVCASACSEFCHSIFRPVFWGIFVYGTPSN